VGRWERVREGAKSAKDLSHFHVDMWDQRLVERDNSSILILLHK
jgi:hypothetical protein